MIIHREDNFLSSEHCNYLINFFKNNTPKPCRDTFILKYKDLNILEKINLNFKEYNLHNPDHMEIVRWPTGSKMDLHYDLGDRLSFIIYLNDDFKGGETIIDNITITPKIGRIVLFSNGIYKHEVKKINVGNRYTLIAWYK